MLPVGTGDRIPVPTGRDSPSGVQWVQPHVGHTPPPHVVGEPTAAVVRGHQDPVRPALVPHRACDLQDRVHEVAAAELKA